MAIEKINEQVTVSGQISAEDVAVMAAQGVELVVCNRPDGEDEGQPDFAEIEKAAKAANIEAVNIPFVGGAMSQAHVEAFRPYLNSGKRIHAYCRSGRRSRSLWEACQ